MKDEIKKITDELYDILVRMRSDVKEGPELTEVWVKLSKLKAVLVGQTTEYYCIECKTLCAVYEQGLSCDCGSGRWETEKYYEEDYPDKWKKVICEIRLLEAEYAQNS